MKSNSIKKIICSTFLAVVMLAASIPLNALAASAENKGLQPPILQGVQREVKTYEEPLERVAGDYQKAPERAMNSQSKAALTELSINPAEAESVEVIEEPSLNRTVRRVEFETARADYDEKGNLVD